MKKLALIFTLTLITIFSVDKITTQAQTIGYDETGTMIPAMLQMYNDRFITSEPFGVYQTEYDVIFRIHTERGTYGIEKTLFIVMDEYLYNDVLTWNFHLPKRETMFDYPNAYPPPLITPMYSNITVLDLDTGNFFTWDLSHSTTSNVSILFPDEVMSMNNLVVYLEYFNPPTPTGTSPEDMWDMGYQSGYEDGESVATQQAYDDGYLDGHYDGYNEGKQEGLEENQPNVYEAGRLYGYSQGIQASEPEAYQQGYNDGANDSFLGNFHSWIVPAIIVVMFVGGSFAVVRMKRDN